MIAKFIKSKIIGVLLIALSIVALALAVMMYTGSSKIVEQYQQMTGETISRRDGAKLVFLKAYVTATGEVEFLKSMGKSPLSVGLADGSVTNNDPSTGPPGGGPPGGGPTPPPTITVSDLSGAARAICNEYTKGISGDVYVSSASHSAATKPYATLTINGVEIKPYKIGSVYNRCCNGLASALSNVAGKAVGGSFGYISCADFKTSYGTNIYTGTSMTAGSLEPGDVICIQGHVETVVKKDSNKVYVASAGSTNSIRKVAQQGYSKAFSHGDKINDYYVTWYSGRAIQSIRRP